MYPFPDNVDEVPNFTACTNDNKHAAAKILHAILLKMRNNVVNMNAVFINSLTPKSVPAGTKLVLFGRYVLNIYVGIVRYFLRTTKLSVPKSTYRHNAQIGEYRTILTSAKEIRF